MVVDVEIAKGYKQTEVGVIPLDWEVMEIGELISFQGGAQPPRDAFIFMEKEGYVRLLQIRDYKTDKYASYIPIELARRFCNVDDIMIGRYGPPIFQILNGLSGAYNVALIKAIPSTGILKLYAWYVLKQQKLFDFIEKLSQRTSGQTGIDLVELKKYQIPLPTTLTEQTAIATALSDTDALLTSLDKLIQKKRNIKQGAMQMLLTGKKRLPGFEGEWAETELGKVLKGWSSGATPYRGRPEFYKGDIKWITSGELNYNVIYDTIEKISEEAVKATNLKLIPKGTMLIAITGLEAAGTRGSCAIVGADSTTNQSCMALFPSPELSTEFLFHYYVHYGDELAFKYCQGTKQQSYTGKIIKILPIKMPPTLSEQTAIATVLSDMDAELSALEAKRAKLAAVKVGMMGELLTGRVRLVNKNF